MPLMGLNIINACHSNKSNNSNKKNNNKKGIYSHNNDATNILF